MKIKRPRLVGLALLALLASILILQKYLEFPLDVERKLKTLQPVFQVKVRVWLKLVKEKLGYNVIVTSARRTYSEQMALHLKDARNPKPDPNKPSSHLLGLAVDVNFVDAKTGAPVLRMATPAAKWAPVVALAKACGIKRWGGVFKGYPDNVHFDDIS
jgi:hypothetical protein